MEYLFHILGLSSDAAAQASWVLAWAYLISLGVAFTAGSVGNLFWRFNLRPDFIAMMNDSFYQGYYPAFPTLDAAKAFPKMQAGITEKTYLSSKRRWTRIVFLRMFFSWYPLPESEKGWLKILGVIERGGFHRGVPPNKWWSPVALVWVTLCSILPSMVVCYLEYLALTTVGVGVEAAIAIPAVMYLVGVHWGWTIAKYIVSEQTALKWAIKTSSDQCMKTKATLDAFTPTEIAALPKEMQDFLVQAKESVVDQMVWLESVVDHLSKQKPVETGK